MSDTKQKKIPNQQQQQQKTQNQAPQTPNRTSILLQSKFYLGSKNGKVLRHENKQPFLSVSLAFLLHMMTVTEQNFIRDHLWNSAPPSTATLGARDLDKG